MTGPRHPAPPPPKNNLTPLDKKKATILSNKSICMTVTTHYSQFNAHCMSLSSIRVSVPYLNSMIMVTPTAATCRTPITTSMTSTI